MVGGCVYGVDDGRGYECFWCMVVFVVLYEVCWLVIGVGVNGGVLWCMVCFVVLFGKCFLKDRMGVGVVLVGDFDELF